MLVTWLLSWLWLLRHPEEAKDLDLDVPEQW